ncbi:phosphoethanolamine transferase CptA [Shimwellia pseudoproteus]|uniref:phosphoethanolamine transferase CptA n=1 Tax=Shimwellia pseudoproteus TaxID=570012 RepID=UPI0018EB3A5A|nr:phosphoethanolamine transferase CptA [Shimwellia pseudoproteus]MBJ3815949.1 phosphoethanolamine transferase CptA [Shimwellia pseudoproteus]
MLSTLPMAFSWASLGWMLVFFWYFSTSLQLFILVTGHSGTNGFRDSLLFSSLWLIPCFLFPGYSMVIATVIGVILWATSLCSLAYYVIYRQEFSQSVLFTMFESNATEAREYFSQYFSAKLAIVLVLYTLVGVALWHQLQPVYIPVPWRYGVALVIFYVLLGHMLLRDIVIRRRKAPRIIAHVMSRIEPAAPWQMVSAWYQYRSQLGSLQNLMQENNSLAPLADLNDRTGDEPRTLVLVLGESTQSGRMSLYGYGRETTPLLDAMRQQDPQLTVFNDVVSARPYTIEIMQQILTFADELNPELYLTQPSLMNMMKQAGYKTFWITNQQTMTKRNTMLTVFSRQTDKQYYMNNQRTQSARQYDDVVFAPFQEALDDSAPKKLIIVHLLGTHINYKYRFPEQYAKFSGSDDVVPKGLNAQQLESYNDYGNANLYNDYVVATLINQYKATQPHGFMVFFSDHGEEVYDTPPHDIQGRNEGAPTRPMYTVPYFHWVSPSWQQHYPQDYSNMTDRPYSLSQFIHTWSDMAGLQYQGWDAQKSLVNAAFQPETRWIGDPYKKNGLWDFDKLPSDAAVTAR